MSECFVLWRLRFAVRLERQRRRSHLYLIRGGLRPTVAEVLGKLQYKRCLKLRPPLTSEQALGLLTSSRRPGAASFLCWIACLVRSPSRDKPLTARLAAKINVVLESFLMPQKIKKYNDNIPDPLQHLQTTLHLSNITPFLRIRIAQSIPDRAHSPDRAPHFQPRNNCTLPLANLPEQSASPPRTQLWNFRA